MWERAPVGTLSAAGLWSIFLTAILASPAMACSLVDASASIAEAQETARLYWIVTAIVAAAIAGIALYKRQLSTALVLAIPLVAFHPSWTVAPLYGPDCSFINIESSQVVLAAACCLLAYEVFRLVRTRFGTER